MKLGVIINSNDSETVWNAFRLANFSLRHGDTVKVFLMGKGVECESIDTETFSVTQQLRSFIDEGGIVYACGSCMKIRQSEGSEACPFSTIQDCYDVIKDSEKVITF